MGSCFGEQSDVERTAHKNAYIVLRADHHSARKTGGLLPLGIGLGTGAEIIQPVAIVCIGGLTDATLMTVFIVPVLYDLLRRDKKPRPAPAPESAPAPEPVNVPEPAPAAVPEAAPAAPKELSEEMKILLEIRDALKK